MTESADISGADRNFDKVTSAIDALLKIVEEETAAIRKSGVAEIETFSERKGQALMSFNRFIGAGLPSSLTNTCVSKLEVLRKALDVNRSLLQIHIDAVNEVSQIIVRCVQDSQADGTYAQPRQSHGQY
ncbi:MAG: hypothetical protein K2Q28_13445 [Hyphomicrobium sp.]|nr:hypothetical protein [Hyphomicrobium sp.]